MDVLALQVRRYRALARDRAISQQSLENTVASYAQAKARVDRAEAELESARINLAYTRIKAPISGRIGASAVTAGALVTANQASALATIQHLDQVYIDMTQPVVAALKLRREMALGTVASAGRQANRVRLTLEDGSPYVSFGEGGKTSGIEGELLFSESIVNESTATVSLRAVFANPDHVLLPGMYVTAHIETGTLQNAVLIPQRCVLSSSMGEHFVFVLKKDGDDGHYLVERRPVVLRRGIGSQWLLEKGLAQGDLVVVDGLQKVSDGSRVLAEERMDAQGVTPSQPRPNVTQEK